MKKFIDFISPVNLNESKSFDSQFLFKEMAVLNQNAIKKTQSALQFIQRNGIKGAIIGGIAVSHFVSDRALTPDVDFLTSDIDKLKSILDKENIDHKPLASNGEYGGIYVADLDTDFLDVNEGNVFLNNYILKTSVPAQIGGASFQVVNPSVLAIMKLVIGRDKDQTDAFKILPTLPKAELKIHLTALKKHLPEDVPASLIWSYAKSLSTN